jgi:hypothetical protein
LTYELYIAIEVVYVLVKMYYVCETLSLALKAEGKSRVFETDYLDIIERM